MVRTYVSAALTQSVVLNAQDCPNCGVIFAMPDDLERQRRKDHNWFYCPNGHSMSYGPNATEEALAAEKQRNAQLAEERDRLNERLRQERERTDRLSNDLMDKAKELKSLKARANAGVCALCNRQFKDMARHVKSKHEHIPQPPDTAAGEGGR